MFVKVASLACAVLLGGVTIQSSAMLTLHIKEKEHEKTVRYRARKVFARGLSVAIAATQASTPVTAGLVSAWLGAAAGGVAGTEIGIKFSELLITYSSTKRISAAIAGATAVTQTGCCTCCCAAVGCCIGVQAAAHCLKNSKNMVMQRD